MGRRAAGLAALAGYVSMILAANWLITHVGEQAFPGGPHTIPVGFGYRAPSGVLAVGLAFTLRDVVQRLLGKWWTVAGILVGTALSYAVAPSLAAASAFAFLLSEALDFGVYTPLQRRRWVAAVVASNVAGTLVDTVAFLWIAFGALTYWQGQVIGKVEMTLLVLPLLVPIRRATVAYAR